MADLRDRTPGHGLIQRLLLEWERGRIHLGADPTALEVEVEDSAESWYRGVLGERRVGQILQALPDAWTVLHSVPVGRGSRDIDHVVIGPGGVFTINTKYSPGKDVWARGMGLRTDNHPQPYVRKACDEARDASERLTAAVGAGVLVTAVVVFIEPGRMSVHPPLGDALTVVKVVPDADLLESLHSRYPLTAERAAEIAEVAVLPETWHDRPEARPRAGAHLALEFDALQQYIEPGHDGPKTPPRSARAARRRTTRRERAFASALAWLIVGAVAIVGSQFWLHQNASRTAPAPTPTISVTPTTTAAP